MNEFRIWKLRCGESNKLKNSMWKSEDQKQNSRIIEVKKKDIWFMIQNNIAMTMIVYEPRLKSCHVWGHEF